MLEKRWITMILPSVLELLLLVSQWLMLGRRWLEGSEQLELDLLGGRLPLKLELLCLQVGGGVKVEGSALSGFGDQTGILINLKRKEENKWIRVVP